MKKAIIIAAVLIVLGIGLTAVAFSLGADFEQTQDVTHEAKGAYTSISVKTGAADIVIKRSETGKTYAVCKEAERLTYSLTVENGTLILSEQDNRRWYDNIGINIGKRACTVYLPAGAYHELRAEASSGVIDCSESDITYQNAALTTSSGMIKASFSVSGELQVKSSSGRITLSDCTAGMLTVSASSGAITLERVTASTSMNVNASSGRIEIFDCASNVLTAGASSGAITLERVTASTSMNVNASSGRIEIFDCAPNVLTAGASSGAIEIQRLTDCTGITVHTTSGRIRIADAAPQALTAKASSGAIVLERVTAGSMLQADTTSGSIRLELCDAGELALQSSSGSIRGTLLSGKLFDAHSSSGHIECPPPSASAGACRIKTNSGSISFKVVS